MTIESLRVIYDREHSQAGDTEIDFYEWAVAYLLNKETEHKELIKQIKRHLIGIDKSLKKDENE